MLSCHVCKAARVQPNTSSWKAFGGVLQTTVGEGDTQGVQRTAICNHTETLLELY